MARARHIAHTDVLDELLCFDLYAASRALTRRYRPLLEEYGLTYPQYLVLVVLGGDGPSSFKELAGTLRLDHATLTPMLRRMEGAGLVSRERDPDDARVVRLALTEHGARVCVASKRIQYRISTDLGLVPEEARRLQLLLRDVATSVERALDPAG